MQDQSGQLIHCPHCWGTEARRSKSRRAFDVVMEIFQAAPLRCRDCGNRFYKRMDAGRAPSEARPFGNSAAL